tara:strand:- start:7241 stop:8842 length:1602 start_codon:yes stop_codon:yes gene_type:complete
MKQKKSGSYYTPPELSDFMVDHATNPFSHFQHEIKILEPSFGEGAFIKSLQKRIAAKKDFSFALDAVELDRRAFQAVSKSITSCNFPLKIFNKDFLFFSDEDKTKYDLVIGNPPYIVKKLLSDKQERKCKSIHKYANLADKSVNNIWTSFLASSVLKLSANGILAFVLPFELLQVKFAEELRELLVKTFERIEIFTFSKIIFSNIEQDTVLLFGYKKSKKKGLFFCQIDSAKDLYEGKYCLKKSNYLKEKPMKWSNHILTENEMSLLFDISNNLKLVDDYCNSAPGIVTAANKYFIVTEKTAKKYKLKSICRPIIQKGLFVNGKVDFDERDFDDLKNSGKPCYLLCFPDKNEDYFSDSIQQYLQEGLESKIEKRFKCLKRDKWYRVSLIGESDAFFFKRSHLYPKLLVNKTKTLVTDSAYRISAHAGYDVNSIAYSFYNSLTLAFAELYGRFYGGGVLELTPNEFKSLPLPYINVSKREFRNFESIFERKKNINNVLNIVDNHILKETLKLNSKTIKNINRIKNKLISRRIKV